MNRNSSSPADDDQLGKIQFLGEDDADNSTVYSQIVNQIKDASNGSEDGRMSFNIITGGADRSFLNMTHDSTQAEVVINEESIDLDFRVESNGNANMLFVDGGNNAVVIGHNDATNGTFASSQAFQVVGTSFTTSSVGLTRFSADANGPSISLSKSRAAGIGTDTVVQDNDVLGDIIFTGADGTDLVTQGALITAA